MCGKGSEVCGSVRTGSVWSFEKSSFGTRGAGGDHYGGVKEDCIV